MDYSSYTQPDPQDQHQHQQYQDQNQTYGTSSQIQAYDQSSSYQAYNAYYHQYDPNNPYAYYHHHSHDYSNSYSLHQAHPQFYEEPSLIHPPGVPFPHESSSSIAPAEQQTHLQSNQQNGCYSLAGVMENQNQLIPATHFVRPQIGHSPYRGGGRRGRGRPFRGGGRGHFGSHNSRSDGSAPPIHGNRGRGRGGGRHFSSSDDGGGGAAVTLPPPSVLSVTGEVAAPTPPVWPPPRIAWCELCRVDCNTPEILEQHKNGKRHKKNLKSHEELQGLNKVISGPTSSEKVDGFEKLDQNPDIKSLTSENVVIVTHDNRNEQTEQQQQQNKYKMDNPESKSRPDQHGLKRKGRGSRRAKGGKYSKTNEGSIRRELGPSNKRKQAVPMICDLCNVKCDSQAVFETHLIGKKHQANLKRFHGHRALYGDAGLQALYPINVNAASTSIAPQVLGQGQGQGQGQPMTDPQVILAQLLMTYVLSQTQAQQGMPGIPQLSEGAAALGIAPAAGFGLEMNYQQDASQRLHFGSAGGTESHAKVTKTDSEEPVAVVASSHAPDNSLKETSEKENAPNLEPEVNLSDQSQPEMKESKTEVN